MAIILESFSCGPIETNAILLGCPETKEAAAIDVPFEAAKIYIDRAQSLSLKINLILLTHSHWDHIAEVALLKQKTGVQVFVHREDAPNLEQPGSDRLPLYFPLEGIRPDGYLEEGQIISVGSLDLEVIHTPGHSPGGVCFYIKKEKILISGDTLFQGSIGNISLPTARAEQMWDSLKKLAKLPAETKVFPGHGSETTIGKEQWIVHAKNKYN